MPFIPCSPCPIHWGKDFTCTITFILHPPYSVHTVICIFRKRELSLKELNNLPQTSQLAVQTQICPSRKSRPLAALPSCCAGSFHDKPESSPLSIIFLFRTRASLPTAVISNQSFSSIWKEILYWNVNPSKLDIGFVFFLLADGDFCHFSFPLPLLH